jgi:Protein of unknown function (DUF1822)
MTERAFNHEHTLSLPIAQSMQKSARQFADLFDDPIAARQVYLQSLAVLTVNHYLQMMGIETDLHGSESWHPILRLAVDVSDLNLVGIGSLECRAVLPKKTSCPIPEDVRENRIGYAIVEIDELQRQATILGFAETAIASELAIERLQSLETMLRHLARLRQEQIQLSSPTVLNQWLERMFESDWQSLETFVDAERNINASIKNAALRASTTAIKAAKLIDWGIELETRSLVLLVVLTPEENEQVGILVQVHPAQGKPYLPPDLKLAVLSERGEKLKEVCSRSLDNYIQLPYFQGIVGERFQIQICLDRVCMKENFII